MEFLHPEKANISSKKNKRYFFISEVFVGCEIIKITLTFLGEKKEIIDMFLNQQPYYVSVNINSMKLESDKINRDEKIIKCRT